MSKPAPKRFFADAPEGEEHLNLIYNFVAEHCLNITKFEMLKIAMKPIVEHYDSEINQFIELNKKIEEKEKFKINEIQTISD